MKQLLITTAAVVLVGCGESDHQHSHDHGQSHAEGDHDHAESDGHGRDKELKAAKTEKTELALKYRVVGQWDLGGVTLIFDKNGMCKAMMGGNLMASGTWSIKDGKIHTVSDDALKNLVIYEMLDNGNLKHPLRGELIRMGVSGPLSGKATGN